MENNLKFTFFLMFVVGATTFSFINGAIYSKNLCGLDKFHKHLFNFSSLEFLLIGHAYGTSQNDNLAEKLDDFLNHLQKSGGQGIPLIFSGDVFHTPTVKKWSNLQNYADNIIIAPGNHDIIDGDAFEKRPNNYLNRLRSTSFWKTFPNDYPFSSVIGKTKNVMIVVLDTNNPEIDLGLNRFSEAFKAPEIETILIISHHVIDTALKKYSHGEPEHFLSKESVKTRALFIKKLSELSLKLRKNILLVAGDTGMNSEYSSFNCEKRTEYFLSIANGLGDRYGDKIIGFSNAKLVYVEL